MEDRFEQAMCDLVLAALRAEGRDAIQTGRPDREPGGGRRADFMLAIDGEPIALEVTRTASEVQQRHAYLSHRLGEGIKTQLSPAVMEQSLGHVLFSYRLRTVNGEPPSRRLVDAAITEIARMLVDAIPLAIERGERLSLRETDVVERLTVNVQQTGTNAVSYMSGVGAAFVTAAADDAVQHLLAGKSEQLEQYLRAYLVISEPTGFVDPQHLADALARAGAAVPANWLRVYMLDRTSPPRVDLILSRD